MRRPLICQTKRPSIRYKAWGSGRKTDKRRLTRAKCSMYNIVGNGGVWAQGHLEKEFICCIRRGLLKDSVHSTRPFPRPLGGLDMMGRRRTHQTLVYLGILNQTVPTCGI